MKSAARPTAKSARTPATKAGARITEHHLENGLQVILAERHLDPVVAVMLWYRVGARDEAEDEAGVSHFLEHMMFKGSRRFGKGKIDLVTTTLGGSNNAFTGADHTAYWFEFASDRWEKALEIEADRMRNLLFDPAEFEAEKAVVLEELAMGEDDPWRRLTQEVHLTLFPRHPYRRPIIGFADTLRALTAERMRAYYERSYRPRNAILVLCGDFQPARALAVARRHFGGIDAARKPARLATAPRPPQEEPRGERRLVTTWDDSGSRLCIGWPTVAVGADDDWRLDLVSALLTGGRLSRLYRRLVLGKGLATSVSTHNDARVDAGAFWLFAECAQGVRPQRLERAIDAEIESLAREIPSAPELARAKKTIVASEAYDSETVSDLAEDLGEFAIDANWRLALDAVERVKRVSAAEVRDAASRLLRPERRVVGWCLPKKAAADPRAKKSAKTAGRPAKKRPARSSVRGSS